jgi:hypothetical protein
MSVLFTNPYNFTPNTTAQSGQVNADYAAVKASFALCAAEGANSDITSLSGLTTPLSETQGGTGSAVGPILWGYLSGLTLSNDGVTPNSVLDIAAGYCVDSTNNYAISFGAFTKSTGGSWVAGSGANGMGVGLTIAANTWYHVFAIINASASDIYFDTSPTAANAPLGTTAFRRIGSFATDVSSYIIPVSQDGDEFLWVATGQSWQAGGLQALTTAAAFPVLPGVPSGVKVWALLTVGLFFTSAINSAAAVISSPDEADLEPEEAANSGENIVGNLANSIGAGGSGVGNSASQCSVRTNTLAEIRTRGTSTSAFISIVTRGWIDRRGRDG